MKSYCVCQDSGPRLPDCTISPFTRKTRHNRVTTFNDDGKNYFQPEAELYLVSPETEGHVACEPYNTPATAATLRRVTIKGAIGCYESGYGAMIIVREGGLRFSRRHRR